MDPRLRRLQADHQQVQAAFANHPYIRVLETQGVPPEKYVIEFRVKSLVPQGESFTGGELHRAEIFLLMDYPRRAPFCRMITPVFHPNIDPQKICLGDHWSAGQSLAQLAVLSSETVRACWPVWSSHIAVSYYETCLETRAHCCCIIIFAISDIFREHVRRKSV